MSRLSEIQEQYRGYVAASEAVKKTDPGDVEVVYKAHDFERETDSDDGLFIYFAEDDYIKIVPRRGSSNYIGIRSKDMPALIKALREFIE